MGRVMAAETAKVKAQRKRDKKEKKRKEARQGCRRERERYRSISGLMSGDVIHSSNVM